jgi:hypothetical protein
VGCNAIPIGYRSIHLSQAENVLQMLEWKVGFAQAESILLNSLKSVHWRCLILSSLLFRAFIAPLGPLGIGAEHFRNILYLMCNREVVWNYERPGNHLKAFLTYMYLCLGRGDMPNFFIKKNNMLRNLPPQNVTQVQSSLSRVRNNLLIYCIFAFRNLSKLQTNFYPMPKLKKLYKIITTRDEQTILFMVRICAVCLYSTNHKYQFRTCTQISLIFFAVRQILIYSDRVRQTMTRRKRKRRKRRST